MKTIYDYVFIGYGLAATSLIVKMSQDSFFYGKKILIIESSQKRKNQTRCFWSQKLSDREQSIIDNKWTKLEVSFHGKKRIVDTKPYSYYRIDSRKWYNTYDKVIKNSPLMIDVVHQKVNDVKSIARKYPDSLVFSSIPTILNQEKQDIRVGCDVTLYQSFLGYLCHTEKETNHPVKLMEFIENDVVSFFYVLPVSKNKVLVEYTQFSDMPYLKGDYARKIKQYCSQYGEVVIQEKEEGVIPMTSKTFTQYEENIWYIGSAGGCIKPSSGYSYSIVQKDTIAIIDALKKGKARPSVYKKRHRIYDKIMLQVIKKNPTKYPKYILDFFSCPKKKVLFDFLNEKSNVKQELNIILTVPIIPFIYASLSLCVSYLWYHIKSFYYR